MNPIYLSYTLIAVFISLLYFYSFRKRQQIKKEKRQEKLVQLQEDLLATLREKPNNNPPDERSDATEA